MSQVFSGDSVNNSAAVTLTGTTETTMATGNFVSPPFGNAKAMVSGSVNVTLGTAAVGLFLRIRRNPSAENAQIGPAVAVNGTAGNTVQAQIQVADAIPDGRPVQYAVTAAQSGASGAGTGNFSNVSVVLISG